MANLIPFRGVLYDPASVGDVGNVIAPPYDIIDAAGQAALHARHPHNVIRVELGLDEPGDGPGRNRYTRAAQLLRDWLAKGALARDRAPAVYPYQIDYQAPGAAPGEGRRVLKGFLCTVELAEFGTGHIYPHENTRSAAKADRMELLSACRANVSPIFSLFSDPDGGVLALIDKSIDVHKPRFEFQDDSGCRQRLWTIADPSVLQALVEALRPKPLFIADGHHRYETALAYRRRRREEAGLPAAGGLHPFDGVLMLLSSLEDPGLTVLPTHRVLTTPVPPLADLKRLLGEACDIEPIAPDRFLQTLRSRGRTAPVFGLALRGETTPLLLSVKPAHRPNAGASERDKLDVSLLQTLVMNRLCPSESDQHALIYTKDDQEALDLVAQGKATASLLLNPTKVAEVRAVAQAGERMPHKSTYFFPKPLTGLVMNVMQD
jgi:uncharacterized protein (DUF1015 family)